MTYKTHTTQLGTSLKTYQTQLGTRLMTYKTHNLTENSMTKLNNFYATYFYSKQNWFDVSSKTQNGFTEKHFYQYINSFFLRSFDKCSKT